MQNGYSGSNDTHTKEISEQDGETESRRIYRQGQDVQRGGQLYCPYRQQLGSWRGAPKAMVWLHKISLYASKEDRLRLPSLVGNYWCTSD